LKKHPSFPKKESSSTAGGTLPLMQIHVIAVGKIRERYLQEGIHEYAARLQPYTTLKIHEVSDVRIPPHPTDAQNKKVQEEEGAFILAAIPPGAGIIALHPEGEQVSSQEFAEKIRRWEIEGPHRIAFLIGGELGLSAKVLEAADFRMSLSRMTFPHQMVRLILLEALYRAFRKVRGEPYQR
jgi:23S rRNA (pseudouridine1915-N3)-methyltransferase